MLQRAQRGDASAFTELVRPHFESIRRFAYSFSRSWQDADDLAQEALLKAFQSLPSFQAQSALATWLYTVTRNVCIDHHRTRAVRTAHLYEPLSDELPEAQTGPDDAIDQRREAAQLWAAIRRLEPEFRGPLVLFEIEGMSYEEVARIEQIPVGTVRSRLSRARRKLADALREKNG
ncbi:MAG TPA: sigma-70 family RNA polymerase sigma factor, partial [Polyangiaceae bacterium]|nr:sigma-70 family RNA polymerase sigma factor [Polyangiaceae bacterium]